MHKEQAESTPPDLEITHDDVLWIKSKRKQEAHEEWLRGQFKVIWPWVVSIIGAFVAAAIWIKEHVRL